MPSIVTIDGEKYVSLAALKIACADPQVVANATAMLSVGYERGDSLANILSIVLGGFAMQVAGEASSIEFSPEQLGKIGATIHQPVSQRYAELRRAELGGKN